MKKAIPTELTQSNITAAIDLLASTPATLESLSQVLTYEQLHQPLGPGERSFTQDLAHLINSEARSSEAIYLALLVDEPELIAIHSERQFGKLLRFERLDFSDLLAYFKIRRTVLLRVLGSLIFEQWSRTVNESGKNLRESVYWKARSLAMHELEHLADLEKNLTTHG